jgi:hypothetical protein
MLSFPVMRTVTLRAHFDGEHIHLDEPCDLKPDAPLLITIWPSPGEDRERETWEGFSGLEAAYAEDEPDYPLDLIKEPNPDYEGR